MPYKYIEYNGETKSISNWARSLGIRPLTLAARLRGGVSIDRAMCAGKLPREISGKWHIKGSKSHRMIAGSVTGGFLPKGAVVHHVDGIKINNEKSNLVICPNEAYHQLIHRRQRALEGGGSADHRKCWICGEYDDIDNLYLNEKASSTFHRACENKRKKENYYKNKEEINRKRREKYTPKHMRSHNE